MVNSDSLLPPQTVSVVVPCFNAGEFIVDAVESIKSQTGSFSITKIIIVDDHSNDSRTQEALEELRQRPLVQVLRNNRTKGPAGARNTGAFAACGNWLAFLDADDIWLPGSLAARFDALKIFPDAAFISGDFQIWDPISGTIEPNFFASRPRPSEFYGEAYRSGLPRRLVRPVHETLATALCHSCSVLVKRDLFHSVRGFEERLIYKEDHHLWFKLAHKADLVIVPQSVFLYRQHSSNMTRFKVAPFTYGRRMLDFILSTSPEQDVVSAIHSRYREGLVENARWLRGEGHFRCAVSECIGGLRKYPFHMPLWRQFIASILHYR